MEIKLTIKYLEMVSDTKTQNVRTTKSSGYMVCACLGVGVGVGVGVYVRGCVCAWVCMCVGVWVWVGVPCVETETVLQ